MRKIYPNIRQEKRKAYQKAYHLKHRGRITAQHRQWREERRDYLRIRWWFRKRFNTIMDKEGEHRQERKHHLKKKYGMTPAEYDLRVADQGGVCAVCSRPERKRWKRRYLSIDHDHKTGMVRGLICSECNLALGYVHDDPQTLLSMIAYLAKHGEALRP